MIIRPEDARGPIVVLELPASEKALDLLLINNTTGKSLILKLPAAWPGTDLTLDFYRRTIKDPILGTDWSSLLSPTVNSLWLATEPLAAGANDVELSAVGYTGPLSPGTVANDAAAGTTAWTNPANAAVSDDTYATINILSFESQWLKATKFGFTFPAAATGILGIVAEVEKSHVGSGALIDLGTKLAIAGVISGTSQPAVPKEEWNTSDTFAVYGGVTNLWGLAPTIANLTNVNFGFGFRAFGETAGANLVRVDSMRMTAYYSMPYAAKATLKWEKGYF